MEIPVNNRYKCTFDRVKYFEYRIFVAKSRSSDHIDANRCKIEREKKQH